MFKHIQHVLDQIQHVLDQIKTKMYNNSLKLHANKFADKELIVQYFMFYTKVEYYYRTVFIAEFVHKLEICYVLYGVHGDVLQYNTVQCTQYNLVFMYSMFCSVEEGYSEESREVGELTPAWCPRRD